MGQAIRTVHRNSNQSTHRCLVSGVLALSMSPADVSPGDSADGATSIISGLQAAGANNAGPTSSWLSEIHRWISLNTIFGPREGFHSQYWASWRASVTYILKSAGRSAASGSMTVRFPVDASHSAVISRNDILKPSPPPTLRGRP